MSERWVLTGCAGFIGSHVLERFLSLGHEVIGVDNFHSGSEHNLDAVKQNISALNWKNFKLIKADIRDESMCRQVSEGATGIIHHAALASVPESFVRPTEFNAVNVLGTRYLLEGARRNGVAKFIFASSSAVYGDTSSAQKKEIDILNPQSPYAENKLQNEKDAADFGNKYGIKTVGFRYFNVFGPRQDPAGAYAAVISKWSSLLKQGKDISIFGDGNNSRDFIFVSDVVDAIICAANRKLELSSEIFNIGSGVGTSLNELASQMMREFPRTERQPAISYLPKREGDILHSCANISRARKILGFSPRVSLAEGLRKIVSADN